MFEQRGVLFKYVGKIAVIPVICILPLVVDDTKDISDPLNFLVCRIHLATFVFLFDNFYHPDAIKYPTRSSMT